MQTKVEGLIISKIPYDERHIIANVLLRTGRKVSIVFYGGRGGGKKQKSSILEIGFMLSIELAVAKNHTEIYHAKEWNLIWNHDHIRLSHSAFYLMCFFVEMTSKIAPNENLHELHPENQEMVGLFNTLSNALVFLERSLISEDFHIHAQALIFITKLLLHLGIYPEREHCTLCGELLGNYNDMFLLPEEGGFACPVCMNKRTSMKVQSGRELWELLGHIAHNKYADLKGLRLEFRSLPKMLFHYFCFQFHLEEKDFKAAPMVF